MISIRPFEPHDWPAVWRIIEPVFRAGDAYAYSPNISQAESYQVWIESPSATFVAEDRSGRVVGTYFLKPNQPDLGAHVCNCGYIVDQNVRHEGIGDQLCEHSLKEAMSRGFRAMQYNLVVATNTAAIHLWKKYGFEVIGIVPNAFKHPRQGFVDALIMYKQLQP